MEAFQANGENVVIFQLESGDRRWYIVGYYLAPDDALTIEDVVSAIGKQTWGAVLLVVRDFNTELAALEGQDRENKIIVYLEEEGLEEMIGQLIPHHKLWLKDSHTWDMH